MRKPDGLDDPLVPVAMSRPVIGLTCYVERARWNAWDEPAALIGQNYVGSLANAGALVAIIPPDATDELVLDRIDGLVLSGGPDVDPSCYGATPHAATGSPRRQRDTAEIALYRGARERNMPVLGICRGLQIMAVATEGSLHQHLPDLVANTVHRKAPGTFTEHGATFAPGSLIAKIAGEQRVTVNSSHHQAVADPGALTVTGWADDGTIEVAADLAAHFSLGVQWHPEAAGSALSARLFAAFVVAARNWVASGRDHRDIAGSGDQIGVT